MKKQREEEDFWDEHEDLRSKSSSDQSRFDEFRLDEWSADEENLEMDNGMGDNTQVGLGDNDFRGGLQLEENDPSFRPVWKNEVGGYSRGVKG